MSSSSIQTENLVGILKVRLYSREAVVLRSHEFDKRRIRRRSGSHTAEINVPETNNQILF